MTLQSIIDQSRRIVFFGGAGVSTESGIPDFRSVDGLYHQQYDVPPEIILSHTYFMRNPESFFRFYRQKMLPLSADMVARGFPVMFREPDSVSAGTKTLRTGCKDVE